MIFEMSMGTLWSMPTPHAVTERGRKSNLASRGIVFWTKSWGMGT
jgi:hypothetical protein